MLTKRLRGSAVFFALAIGTFGLAIPVSGSTAPAPAGISPLHYSLPATPVQPEPCPAPPLPPAPPPPPLGAPIVPDAAIPVVKAPSVRKVNLGAISGKGIWLTDWPGDVVDVQQVVATAKAAGLHQIWLRTGSTHDGFYAGPVLSRLVPAAHAVGIAVVAWDYPTMSNPAVDAARAKAVFRLGVDAFSPDIEFSAEGTYLTARRVSYYLSLVRAMAGNKPIVATVPRPTTLRLTGYPYAAEAPFVDVFAPMVYWSCAEPGAAVGVAIKALAGLRPVAPVGQDYNMASEGGRHGLPTGPEIWRFLNVAAQDGAVGASLYDLESGGPIPLETLAGYPWTAHKTR